jgi:selenocysteine lyase/cysteine desulfurase
LAPHRRLNVQTLDCDFLTVSAYKFFGPHLGVLYGRYDVLARLRAYKVRPASDAPPGKFETGTQLHENIVGALGAAEYLAELSGLETSDWTARLDQAFQMIEAYEAGLTERLVTGLSSVAGLRLYGISETRQLGDRLPTVSFTLEGRSPRQIAQQLGDAGFNVWDGDFYAPAVTERLQLDQRGGLVRVGAVHYNTEEEINRLVETLRRTA